MKTKKMIAGLMSFLMVISATVSPLSWAGSMPTNQSTSQILKSRVIALGQTPPSSEEGVSRKELLKDIEEKIKSLKNDLTYKESKEQIRLLSIPKYVTGEIAEAKKNASALIKKAEGLILKLQDLVKKNPAGREVAADKVITALNSMIENSDSIVFLAGQNVAAYIKNTLTILRAYVKAVDLEIKKFLSLYDLADKPKTTPNELAIIRKQFDVIKQLSPQRGDLPVFSPSDSEKALIDEIAMAEELIKNWNVITPFKVSQFSNPDVRSLTGGLVFMRNSWEDKSGISHTSYSIVNPSTGKTIKEIYSFENGGYYHYTAVSPDNNWIAISETPDINDSHYPRKPSIVLFNWRTNETATFFLSSEEFVKAVAISVGNDGMTTILRAKETVKPLSFTGKIETVDPGNGHVEGHVTIKIKRGDKVLAEVGLDRDHIFPIPPSWVTQGDTEDTYYFSMPLGEHIHMQKAYYRITVTHADGSKETFDYEDAVQNAPATPCVIGSVSQPTTATVMTTSAVVSTTQCQSTNQTTQTNYSLMVFSKGGRRLQELEVNDLGWHEGTPALIDRGDKVYLYRSDLGDRVADPEDNYNLVFNEFIKTGGQLQSGERISIPNNRVGKVAFSSNGDYVIYYYIDRYQIQRFPQTMQTPIYEDGFNNRIGKMTFGAIGGDYDPRTRRFLVLAGHYDNWGWPHLDASQDRLLVVYNMAAQNPSETKQVVDLVPFLKLLGLQQYIPTQLVIDENGIFTMVVATETHSGWDGHQWRTYDRRVISGSVSELCKVLGIKV